MIIIHPGTHKTGTSTLQSFLYRNRNEFAENGWCYSNISRNHSGPLCSIFKNNTFNYFYYKKHQNLDCYGIYHQNNKVLHSINNELLEFKNIIFSGEDLSFLSIDELFRMKAFLKKHQEEIKIVLYYRKPKNYICSAIQQHLKGGIPLHRILKNPPKYQFYTAYNNYKLVFGEEACITRSYEKLANKSIIDDFLATIDLPFSLKESTPKNTNVSLSRYACYLLNTFNIAGNKEYKLGDLELLSKLDRSPLLLEESWNAKLEVAYKGINIDFTIHDTNNSADWFISEYLAKEIIDGFFSQNIHSEELIKIILNNSDTSEKFAITFVNLLLELKDK
jgi:hypothetical protein